jgi:hypothetical protein
MSWITKPSRLKTTVDGFYSEPFSLILFNKYKKNMNARKFFISLFFLALFALTFVACSGTKNICPAYTQETVETPATPSS